MWLDLSLLSGVFFPYETTRSLRVVSSKNYKLAPRCSLNLENRAT